METDASLASQYTVVANPSPGTDSRINESLSTMNAEMAPSIASRHGANEQSTTIANSLQAPQPPDQLQGLSEIESEHRTAEDRGTDGGLTTAEPVDSVVAPGGATGVTIGPEISGGALPVLWCPVTERNHGELVNWGVRRCPGCKQIVKRPRPQLKSRVSETQDADTAASTDATARQRDKVRYSNKFLWSNGTPMFPQTRPELLNLGRGQGKLAMTQRPMDEPVIEIVTVVTTNLTPTPDSNFSTDWLISNSSWGTECEGKEVIIHSRRVMNVLRTLITYHPNLDLGGLSLLVSQPYALFYHYHEEIKEFQSTYHRVEEDQPRTEDSNTASKRTHLKICDEETYKHLEVVREFIEQDNLAEVQEEIERHHQTPAVATYSMLWLLFRPGTKVYVRRQGSPVHVGVVLSVQGGALSPTKSDPFSIDYWTLEFDGFRLGRCSYHFFVKSFAGERRISELEVSPCSYYDAEDAGGLRDTLIHRGQEYWRFLQGRQVDYQGKLPKDQRDWQGRVMVDPMTYYRYVYRDPDHPHGFQDPALIPPDVGGVSDLESELPQPKRALPQPVRPPPQQMRPPPKGPGVPIMPSSLTGWSVDRTISTGRSQNWQTKVPHKNENGPWADYDDIIPGPDTQNLELIDSVTGEKDMSRYLLCPPNVVGFDLKARQWQLFDVACCHDVAFNHGAIDSLVMKEERKSVIKSLVHRYTALDSCASGNQVPKPWTADFIKNKGEGQIFLLHGSPGVGKTYVITRRLYFSKTAECIAEATRRPLLSLTCGDIGTNEVLAERTLLKWFRLAEIWGAVMLLDEADVFLEKRSISDLQRNSLVSVFLRIVEYYRGILFLTTNRVGQFDDAFINRIHTVIHYENFSRTDQDRIWSQFFMKLENERRKDIRIHQSARDYISSSNNLRKIEWNGRQIRNAFQTAVAFAEYRFMQTKPEQRHQDEASLEDQDFAKVCEMTIAFQEYMASVHGGDEYIRARLERIRDDKFKEGSGSL